MARLVFSLIVFGFLLLPSSANEPLRHVIDREIAKALNKHDLKPAGRADDATFLRRVYLDLAGTVPTYEEARAFLDDSSESKRETLVDRLLQDKRHARHQAETWDLILFTRKPANPSATRKRQRFQKWLRAQFEANTPYDKLVRKILRAEEDDSAMFHVQYRNKPEDETVAVSRIFLGTQLQCARCHDHPFDDDLKQRDFYGMAGFFVRLMVLEDKDGKEKIYRIGEKSSGEVKFTDVFEGTSGSGKKGKPVHPKFLGSTDLEEPALPADFKEPDYRKAKGSLPKPYFSRKEKFAEWLTAPDNPFFARAAVNRLWAQFMGRGLVHPVDNLKLENHASHPELLEQLTKEFISNGFDMNAFIRELVLSDTYQRDSAGPGNEAAPKWFGRARVRPLTAEELMASLRVVTGFDRANGEDEKLPSAGKDYMLRIFGEPNDGRGNFQGGVDEHLFLNNGGQLRSLIRRQKGNLSESLLTDSAPWPERVDRLFLSTITRLPTEAERNRIVDYITAEEKPDKRLEEAIWALLNSSRFRFNY